MPSARTRLLLTVPEAAEQLAVSESTVKRLVRRGALGSVLVESRRRIPQRALDAFVSELEKDSERRGRQVTRRLKAVR
jgi:excisionase family DNA binding protein